MKKGEKSGAVGGSGKEKALPNKDGVYMHPQVLALGLMLLLTRFVCSVLIFYRVAPSQLSVVAWHTVLRCKALCALFAPEVCQCESSAPYMR